MNNYYETAKEFALNHIKPFSKETDEKGIFPEESFKKMGEQGYFKLLIPESHGGLGQTLVEHSEVCLAFAEESASAGLCYMMHNVALMCILTYGSKELQEKIFADVVENNKFLALAYSEFGTGTHFYIPNIKAEAEGNITTFNGYKSMVTSANYASYYLVLAPSSKEGQINNWIFPLNTPGLTFEEENWNGLGMRGNASCPMKIDNVKLDSLYKIGEEGSGAEQVFSIVVPFFVTGLASVYSGVAKKISEYAGSYAQERKYPDGSSLANIETVQIHLSDIYTKAAATRYLTKEAAVAGSKGEEDALAKILAARINASEIVIECGRLAMRIGGGKAYNKAYAGDNPLERLLRYSYAGQIMAPSVDVLKIWLGKALTGQMIP